MHPSFIGVPWNIINIDPEPQVLDFPEKKPVPFIFISINYVYFVDKKQQGLVELLTINFYVMVNCIKKKPQIQALHHVSIGIQLAVTVLFFIFAGYHLDKRYDMAPLFLILGAFFGMAAGFYSLIRQLMSLSKREASFNDEDDHHTWM